MWLQGSLPPGLEREGEGEERQVTVTTVGTGPFSSLVGIKYARGAKQRYLCKFCEYFSFQSDIKCMENLAYVMFVLICNMTI